MRARSSGQSLAVKTACLLLTCLPAAALAQEEAEGELRFGIWYEEAEELAVSAGITQHRIAGRDDTLRFDLSASQYSQSAYLTLTDPDFFEGPYSRDLAFSIRSHQPNSLESGDYTITQAEASIGFGRQWSDVLSTHFGLGVTQTWFDNTDVLPVYLSDYTDAVGEQVTDLYAFGSAAWDRTLDLGWQRQGSRLRINGQIGAAGGEGYALAYLSADRFQPLGDRVELRARGGLGLAGALGDGPYPVLRNFAAGGPGSVRGYAEGTLGPQSAVPGSDNMAFPGGRFLVTGSLEMATPLSLEHGLFGVGYVDVGNVFASAGDFDSDGLRASVGIGVTWESPLGTLSVFASQPLNDEPGDQISEIQFGLGMRY